MKIHIKGLSRYLTDDEHIAEVIQHQIYNPEFLLKMDMLIDNMKNSEERMKDAQALAEDVYKLLGEKDVAQCLFALAFNFYIAYKEIFTEIKDGRVLVK